MSHISQLLLITVMAIHYKGEATPDLVKYDKGADKLTLKPRSLNIIWAGDPQYWKLSPQDGPAELQQVSWLEVSGQVNLNQFMNKAKEYAVKFRVELMPENFGWEDGPVYLMVKAAGHPHSWKKADLSTMHPGEIFDLPVDRLLTFKAPESCGADDKLQFGIYEIWRGSWKGGLVIHEVVIEPVRR